MNGRELSENLKIPIKAARALLRDGIIEAKKEGREWKVSLESLMKFKKKNRAKIRDLKAEYVELYWQGLTIEQLQRRVRSDFERLGIVCRSQGFAERAIYDSLMDDKKAAQ